MSTAPSQPESPIAPAARPDTGTRLAWLAAALLALVGVVARVAPLLDQGGRLWRQWPHEDGYLMLQIARYLALGQGMSTAEGLIPTNGTQPLCTFLWAGCFALVGGDKYWGVLLVLVLSLLISAAAGGVLFALGRLVFARHPHGVTLAAVAAALWFAAPSVVDMSMNCLETGTVALLTIGSIYGFLRASTAAHFGLLRAVGLGLLLGLTFWARIDAALLIAALCVVRVLYDAQRRTWAPLAWPAWWPRWRETLVMGATAVVVASPWLIYNKVSFGSIMPISGTAQSYNARFANNLDKLPPALAEDVTIVGAIPARFESGTLATPALTAVLAVFVLLGLIGWQRAGAQVRLFGLIVALYGVLLCGWYGLYFGAPHFINRYLLPLSPLLALLTVLQFDAVVHCFGSAVARLLRGGALAAAMLVVVGLSVRDYRQGTEHMHFQVVDWVQANVPAEAWVGAVQSGTLGFFHDRTINLDGKVNPAALAATRFERPDGSVEDRLIEYVIASPCAYLADWYGILGWHRDYPALAAEFDVVVADEARNLGVLRRTGPPVDSPLDVTLPD